MKVCCVKNLFMAFTSHTQATQFTAESHFCYFLLLNRSRKVKQPLAICASGTQTTSNPKRWGSRASRDRTACLSQAHPPSCASKNHCGESTDQLPAEITDRNAGRQRICKRVNLFKTIDFFKWVFNQDFLLFFSSASKNLFNRNPLL